MYPLGNCCCFISFQSFNFQELASEIILTLGQAFEVAYQMAMKEKAERACNTGQKTYISSNIS